MADCPPNASAMFGDSNDPMEIAERFEAFKAAVNNSTANPRPVPGTRDFHERSDAEALQKALGSAELSKALSPELLDSVRTALTQAQLNKAGAAEWTVSNPVPAGLAAFDLEAPLF